MSIALTLLAAAALHDLNALAADISAATGRPVALDPRLRLERCGHQPIVAGGIVECTAPAWRIFVAPAAVPTAAPLVRRGDPVTVAAAGPGFRVTIEGVAENDAAAGARLRVRESASSRRLTAHVAPDGSITLPGYTSGDLSR